MNRTVGPEATSPLAKGSSGDDQESFMERWLVVPKILYFILNVFVYSFHAVMGPLFMNRWGFPAYLYALATTVVAMNFFGAMLWTTLADKTGRYKSIIVVTATFYSAMVIALTTYQAPIGTKSTVFDYLKVIIGYGLLNFFLSAAFPLLDAQILGRLSKNPKLSKDQFGNQRMFGAVGHFVATLVSFMVHGNKTGTLIFNIVSYVLFVLSVVLGIEDLKVVKGGHHHGHASSKPRVDEKGKEIIRSPSPMPHSEGIQQVPIAEALPMAPTPAPPSAADELASEGGAGVRHPIVTLLKTPSFMFFMVFVAGLGVVRSVTSNFQKLIALDLTSVPKPGEPLSYIGGINEWFEGTLGFGLGEEKNLKTAMVDFGRMLSEIFVYVYAKQMKNAMGIYWIMVGSQLVGILRMAGYGFLDKTFAYAYLFTWLLELIKGFSSGMVSSSAIPIASRIAPAGCESTAQGLFSGMYSGLSNLIAGALSAAILYPLYDAAGGKDKENSDIQVMFLWVSLITLIITLLMAAKFVFIDRVMGLPGFPRRHSMPS